MSKRKGLKRHTSLQPLSRHHMIGLHLALKLKRVGTPESKLTINEVIAEVQDFWQPEGQNHFREEEEILLPVYNESNDVNNPEIIVMLLEHVKIRSGIEKLLRVKEQFAVEEMHALGTLLETHIRREERVIFPMIEKGLTEDQLIDLAPYLH